MGCAVIVKCRSRLTFCHLPTVNNDFHETKPVFALFDGLEVPDLDREYDATSTPASNGLQVNGYHREHLPN